MTYLSIFFNFQNCACCEKDLKDNKHNSLHLTLKICSDICPRTLSVRFSEQIMSADKISEYIFAANGGYCLCICTIPTETATGSFRSKNILVDVEKTICRR